MPLPRSIAHFNKRFTNRLLEPMARRFSNFAVVHHVGRVTGSEFATPVNSFVHDGHLVIALTYGPDADWVRNVLCGPASVESRGRVSVVTGARLVGREEVWPAIPRLVRAVLRVLGVRHFLELSLDSVAR
jgi:deazaflavin-dependent oxidoreductase (nitroreductase family)